MSNFETLTANEHVREYLGHLISEMT